MSKEEFRENFYLGKEISPQGDGEGEPLYLTPKDLTTHALCLGMTGSGKTGLGIALIEEAALQGIPSIVIDPKGDLGNLMLTFKELTKEAFLPWIDKAEAERKGESAEKIALEIAKKWKEGLSKWGESESDIKRLLEKVDINIYTPASRAGIPLSILSSFKAPSDELLLDTTLLRDRILSITSSLLGLLGIDADPIKSREHILISNIIEKLWLEKKDLNLEELVEKVQNPPFNKIGVLDIDTFFPQKERVALSININHLLASSGFQAWMEGEPLDIDSLLYTCQGKGKISVLSIAHLNDSERMFFVTLLLTELISWMRKRPGRSNLSSLLYMDEIFGFFPPVANPPSKLPMITLLKQARAFGLGIILSTQNPSDVDYKGAANCGTWFIGKLQTERDRSKVLEGLTAASNGELNSLELKEAMAKTGSRVFLLRSIYKNKPILFETRWTLSYLKGPLALPEIKKLMENKYTFKEVLPIKNEARVSAPSGIESFYLNTPAINNGKPYSARALALGKLHFVDVKSKVDLWQTVALAKEPLDEGIDWGKAEDVFEYMSSFEKNGLENASYNALPSLLSTNKGIESLNKSFSDYLYQERFLQIYYFPNLKIYSRADEKEDDFKERIKSLLKGDIEGKKSKIVESYQGKIDALLEKISKQKAKASEQESEVSRRKLDTWISVGLALLGSLFGSKKISKGTLTSAGTSFKKAQKISKSEEALGYAEESLATLQERLEALQGEKQKELDALFVERPKSEIEIEKILVRPKKGDITADKIAILWA